MADTKECAAVGALRRPRRTPENDRFTGNWYYFAFASGRLTVIVVPASSDVSMAMRPP